MSESHSRYRLQPAVMKEFLSWWQRLQSETAAGPLRADRATLRRADSIDAIACLPAYQRVFRDMAAQHAGPQWTDYERDRIAAVIGLAAHLKKADEQGRSLPQAMSHRSGGEDRNPVSELRFARLLETPDIGALFTGLRRVMPLIDHQADPAKMANDVFGWGDPIKKRWAYDYNWARKSDT